MQLTRLNLVQFFLFYEHSLEFKGNVAFLGPNGHGKSTLLDAIQIAMLGADGRYMSYNAQSVSEKNSRTLRDYCLGVIGNPEKGTIEGHARSEALSYISLVFAKDGGEQPVTAGICVEASEDDAKHQFNGAFILPGVSLHAGDFMETTEEGRQPLLFKDFMHMARARCASVGRLAFFTDKRKEYVRELILNLSPHHNRLDPDRFAKAFVKSLTLKDADSIDSFVRHHLIDEGPVEVESFGRQLRQLSEMQELVTTTQKRISHLSETQSLYESCRKAASDEAVLTAVGASIAVERNSDAMGQLDEDLERVSKELRQIELGMAKLDHEKVELNETLEALRSAKANNEAGRQQELLSGRIGLAQKELSMQTSTLRQRLLSLSVVLNAMPHKDDVSLSQILQGCRTAVDGALEHLNDAPVESVQRVLDQRLHLSELGHRAAERHQRLLQEQNDLDDTKRDLKARAESFRSHGVDVGGDAGRLMSALAERGIKATPVACLLSISDPAWQPVIEGYLGHNRFALVIEDGRTREAVQVLRALDQQRAVYDVSIVQPHHLKDVTIPTDDDLVIRLLSSNNALALAFAAQTLGRLRQASSDAELEQNARALTKDGMLSKSGGTKRIRLMPMARCVIGMSFAGDDAQLVSEAKRVHARESALKTELDNAQKAALGLSDVKDLDALVETAAAAASSISLCADLNQQLSALDTSELGPIEDEIKKHKVALHRIGDQEKSFAQSVGRLNQKTLTLRDQLQAYKSAETSLGELERQARENPRFDAARYGERMESLEDRIPDSYDERLKECERLRESSLKRLETQTRDATVKLSHYINMLDNDTLLVEVQDLLSDWEAAGAWVNEELGLLVTSRLADQKLALDDAQRKADLSFRTDIVNRLKESFLRIEGSLHDLNRLLKKLPPFGGNERYSFEATPTRDKLSMYTFIIESGDKDDLFSRMPKEVDEQVRELMESAKNPETFVSASKGLTDPRSFYTFDLEMKIDGQRVDTMTTRQGRGSNGEHRTPMYVAAGAALARAYRLNGRENSDSCGLMLLDEAFYGMDNINTFATASFLSDLGFQLIMAAPEADQSKLLPVCTTHFDIDRERFDIDLERIEYSHDAVDLMTSDFSSVHPELLAEQVEKLRIESAT